MDQLIQVQHYNTGELNITLMSSDFLGVSRHLTLTPASPVPN